MIFTFLMFLGVLLGKLVFIGKLTVICIGLDILNIVLLLIFISVINTIVKGDQITHHTDKNVTVKGGIINGDS